MTWCRTLLRKAIAVLGLVAVILGALEHEDLILHELDGVEIEDRSKSTSSPREADGSGKLDTVDPATGTESRFRSESHALGVTERVGLRVAIVPPAPSRCLMVGVVTTTLPAPRSARQTGTVILRL